LIFSGGISYVDYLVDRVKLFSWMCYLAKHPDNPCSNYVYGRYNLFGAGTVRVYVVVSLVLVVSMDLSLFLASFSCWSFILSYLLVLIFSGRSLGISYMGAFCLVIFFYFGVFSTSCTAPPMFALFVSCYSFFIYLYNFPFKKKISKCQTQAWKISVW
jgi:hypothetical protein